MQVAPAPAKPPRHVDLALSILLVVQCLTLFVSIPLASQHASSRLLLDAGHVVFAGVSITVLTRRRSVQLALLGGLALLATAPYASARFLPFSVPYEVIALTAFVFNGIVTTLVAIHVFGAGRVTAHRLQGAVLIYLNLAALFAIAYSLLELQSPGALVPASGGVLADGPGAGTAALTYFSLSTITTT